MTNNNSKSGKLYGIGIGPGDPDLITIKAVKALEKAHVIYVPKSKEQASTALNIVKDYLPEKAIIEHLEFPMAREISVRVNSRKRNADLIAQNLNDGKTSVFLTLGDPMLYSTYSYVLEHLKGEFEIETIPGIYSFAAISSLLSMPLCMGNEKLTVICNFEDDTPALLEASDTVVLMKVSAYHQKLYSFLKQLSNYQFAMITDVGKENQKIYKSIDILKEKVPYFSTIILQKNKRFN